MCAVVTPHIAPLQSQSTGSLRQPLKWMLNFSHTPNKTCSLPDKGLYSCAQRTTHSTLPCHCGFCSIAELCHGNLVWAVYKFSMESASLQALSAASPYAWFCRFGLGFLGGFPPSPISPGFVWL